MREKEPDSNFLCVKDLSIETLAHFLKVITEPNRLRILCILVKGAKCVGSLTDELEISQPLTSHHLGVLKEEGLILPSRQGSVITYSVNEELLDWLLRALSFHLSSRIQELA